MARDNEMINRRLEALERRLLELEKAAKQPRAPEFTELPPKKMKLVPVAPGQYRYVEEDK